MSSPHPHITITLETLTLTLKKKWFDMIDQNIKIEEYRDIKPYWEKRFKPYIEMGKPFVIIFKNGYSKTSPTINRVCSGIRIGKPNPLWCDGRESKCFILGKLRPFCDRQQNGKMSLRMKNTEIITEYGINGFFKATVVGDVSDEERRSRIDWLIQNAIGSLEYHLTRTDYKMPGEPAGEPAGESFRVFATFINRRSLEILTTLEMDAKSLERGSGGCNVETAISYFKELRESLHKYESFTVDIEIQEVKKN